MSRQITKSVQAKRDLSELWAFIAEDSIAAADKLLAAVQNTIVMLSQNPKLGRLRDFRSSTLKGIRSYLVRDNVNYIVFYLATDAEIQIIRVLHGARDLDAMFSADESSDR